jgi:hypothetical protein
MRKRNRSLYLNLKEFNLRVRPKAKSQNQIRPRMMIIPNKIRKR